VQSLVDPGDKVIVLSPYWPFFRGMVLMARGGTGEPPHRLERAIERLSGVFPV
jgi:aspartate/methionine/tyrosine aminotransferase